MVQKWVKKIRRSFFAYNRMSSQHGFLLPVVIALGLGVGTISVLALQTVTQNSGTLSTQYYTQIAREAAQAGVSAAVSCIKASNAFAPAWTDSNPLTPDKNCSFTAPTGTAQSPNVSDVDLYRSTYSVIKPTYQDTNNTSMLITATGSVYVKTPGGQVKAAQVIVHGYGTFPSNNLIVPTNYKKVSVISSGPATTCSIAEDNWAYCWGSNANGQLGIGKNIVNNQQSSPIAVANNTAPTAAISGTVVSCGLFCSTKNPADTPAQPESGLANKKVTRISVGTTQTCAVATDTNGSNGRAYCWGSNDSGQLGNYSTTDSLTAIPVDVSGPQAAIPAVPATGCGFFGCATPAIPAVPAKSASALMNKTVVDITAGDEFSCALTSDGAVACWGNNDSGQLGTGNRTSYTYPVAVDMTFAGTPAVPAVPAIPGQGCGFFGCSVPPVPEVPAIPAVPASALLGKTVTTLAELKGGSTMCVSTNTGDPVCWGQNYAGQVGNGKSGVGSSNTSACSGGATGTSIPVTTGADALRPSAVLGTTKFSSFTVYDGYTTAMSTTNRAYWWGGTTSTSSTRTVCGHGGGGGTGAGPGNNKFEVTTTRTYNAQNTPAGPLYNTGTSTINGSSLALSSGNPKNGLFCAGLSTNNQLYCDANGTAIDQGQTGEGYNPCTNFWNLGCPPIPTGPRTVTMTAFGGSSIQVLETSVGGSTCAVTTDGQVFCWGNNSNGQLGVLPATNRNVPAPVDINLGTSGLYASGAGNGSGTTSGAFRLRAMY